MRLPVSRLKRLIAAALPGSLGLAAMAWAVAADPLEIPDTQLEPMDWSALDGWSADDHIAAFSAFKKSCVPFLAAKQPKAGRDPIHAALWQVCRRAARF